MAGFHPLKLLNIKSWTELYWYVFYINKTEVS